MTGFYSLSRGIGTALGPVCAGAAIQLFRPAFASTHGYAAMWGVCLVSALAMVVGWEALIVLHDLRGLPADEQMETSLWAANALIRAAMTERAGAPNAKDS